MNDCRTKKMILVLLIIYFNFIRQSEKHDADEEQNY